MGDQCESFGVCIRWTCFDGSSSGNMVEASRFAQALPNDADLVSWVYYQRI